MQKTISPIKLLLWVVLALFAASPVHGGNSFEALGEVVTYLLPATALGISAGLKDTDGIIQLGMSGALTVGVSYGLKAAVDETRPNGDSGSFPSTHTSVSFAAAEYMRKRYGNLAFGLPAYAAATLVAVSRVESKEHYVHDVLAGAAIGIASSYIFTKPYKGWTVQPEAGSGYYGLRLSRLW